MIQSFRRTIAPAGLPAPLTAVPRLTAVLLAAVLLAGCSATPRHATPSHAVHLSDAAIRDKIEGAWLGQMIGVTWGFPTEFYARYIWEQFPDFHQEDGEPTNIYARYEGGPIPLDELPEWDPEMINGGYTQDDLYVEVPFLEAMREHGVNADWHALAEAFARSEFPLYHANLAGRENLRAGLRPPASGHYDHNTHADDIDWQIEADFVGLMCPAQPRAAAEIAFRAGHIMNHGDGVYGGVFVATMIASAFNTDSVEAIAETGRLAIPEGSAYRAVLNQTHDDWASGVPYEANLARLYEVWGTNDRCPEWGGAADPLNIDAKLNGAFILLGLLYGEGDLADSMRYATAAGQDSDCNPSNVGSILGAFYGADALAADTTDWVGSLDETKRFQTTPYTLSELIDRNTQLARRVTTMRGGDAPRNGAWTIEPGLAVDDLILEQWPTEPNDPPSLDARAVVEDGTVRFVATAHDPDGIAGIQWHFGDLHYARGAEQRHTYAEPGTYRAVVFASDATGTTAARELTVTVPPRSESRSETGSP